jgi:hypothetical protein
MSNHISQREIVKKIRAKKVQVIRASISKTNNELVNEFGLSYGKISTIRGNTRHKVSGGTNKVAQVWEDWAIEKLIEDGHNAVGQHYRSAYDILVDKRIRVDVKVATKPRKNDIRGGLYAFTIRRKKFCEIRCDFFILIIASSKDVFIIPSDIINDKMYQIAFVWPLRRKQRNSIWQRYHNRWDLIKEAQMPEKLNHYVIVSEPESMKGESS